MTAGIGVLCARMRVEEKQIIAALGVAGIPARLIPPSPTPFPLQPSTDDSVGGSNETGQGQGGRGTNSSQGNGRVADREGGAEDEIVLDRCADRAVARAVLTVHRASNRVVIDAGLAATADRLTIASLLVSAGLPRPVTVLAPSEDAAMLALPSLGEATTLLPLDLGESEIELPDRDIAEAVLEHRQVLGAESSAVNLLQAGCPTADERWSVLVVGSRAVGITGPETEARDGRSQVRELAEATATALQSSLIGVEIARCNGRLVVWDVRPVPAFRDARALGRQSIAEAIATEIGERRTVLNGHAGTTSRANGLSMDATVALHSMVEVADGSTVAH